MSKDDRIIQYWYSEQHYLGPVQATTQRLFSSVIPDPMQENANISAASPQCTQELGLLFLWLPGLIPRPVPLPRIQSMPLGVVDQLFTLTGVVLLVLYKVPSSLLVQQLQHRYTGKIKKTPNQLNQF